MIEDTLDVDLKMFTDIIEDGEKPRSIREIKAKYELNYPFTVKRVIRGWGTAYIIPGAREVGYLLLVTGIEGYLYPKDTQVAAGTNIMADVPMWIFYS